MSLSEPVAVVIGSLVGAFGTGGTAWYLRRKPEPVPEPDRVEVALQARVAELDERLAAQYELRIAYLEALVEDQSRELKKRRRGGND